MPITNVEELREFLSSELERVSKGEITPAGANASANLAGKVLSSVKMELEYNKMAGLTPNIGFLKGLTRNTNKLLHDQNTGEITEKK
jgi:hypothetical protein